MASERTVKVRVTQGCVHVNHVHVEHLSDDAIMLIVDTKAKRPVVGAFCGCENMLGVWLEKDEHTLHAEPTDAPTQIEVELDSDRWHMLANSGRYSVEIGLFRWSESNEVRLAWDDSETVAASVEEVKSGE